MSTASAAETTTLGMTDLEVSRIAFGTWQLGGDWGSFDEAEAIKAIRYARSLGVNFFDTAQAYGYGASERLLGRALRDELDQRRDQLVIATKGGLRMAGEDQVRDSSRAWLRQGVEDSLAALGRRLHRPLPGPLARPRTPPSRRRHSRFRSSWTRARSATSASRTSPPGRWPTSPVRALSRRCSRPITCSGARSRPRCCPTPASTTSACSSTGRSPMVC